MTLMKFVRATLLLPEAAVGKLMALAADVGVSNVTITDPDTGDTIEDATDGGLGAVVEKHVPADEPWMYVLGVKPADLAVTVPVKPRNTVVYRVVDPTRQYNGVAEAIKVWLIVNPNQSRATIQQRLGLKQKSAESFIYKLYADGVVESVPVAVE